MERCVAFFDLLLITICPELYHCDEWVATMTGNPVQWLTRPNKKRLSDNLAVFLMAQQSIGDAILARLAKFGI